MSVQVNSAAVPAVVGITTPPDEVNEIGTILAPPSLLDRLLNEQQQLTAVERFASAHAKRVCSETSSECSAPIDKFGAQNKQPMSANENGDVPAQAKHYTALLPATPPVEGQQYAFEVDLDRCSGCKACVTACHSLNGLDDGETWRDVGLLHGGSAELPVLWHVTTTCHHCLQPACLTACPVDAYEKDELTGIVKHLDDQCFGCQY